VSRFDTEEVIAAVANEFVDTYVAAEELGISRALLWRLLKQRGITRYKQPGERKTLVRRTDLVGLREPMPIEERGERGKAAGRISALAA